MTHNSDPFNSSCPPSLVSLKGQEQYVRLRAGRDGGEFLFPAGVLAQLSGICLRVWYVTIGTETSYGEIRDNERDGFQWRVS